MSSLLILSTLVLPVISFPANVQEFLTKYNYIGRDSYNIDVTNGLLKFQGLFGLQQTGLLDKSTKRLISSPRCDLPDIVDIQLANLIDLDKLWDKPVLKWTYVTPPGINPTHLHEILFSAFNYWSRGTHFRFAETTLDRNDSDITVTFARREHGDNRDFDGPGGVLGHAFFPWTSRAGIVHLDQEEYWSYNNAVEIKNWPDLFSVIVHELGHTFGLQHLFKRESIMFPFYQFVSRRDQLADTDRIIIRDLYRNKTTHRAKTTSTYDVVTQIRGELFLFKDSRVWRYRSDQSGTRPYNLFELFKFPIGTRIDRVVGFYDRFDGKLVIIANNRYYLFDQFKLVPNYPKDLRNFGVDQAVSHVVSIRHGITYFVGTNKTYEFNEYAQLLTHIATLDENSHSLISGSVIFSSSATTAYLHSIVLLLVFLVVY